MTIQSSLSTKLRNYTCNEVTSSILGNKVTICGWLMSKRNHGGIIFADIRDHYGIVQIAIDTLGKDERKQLLHKIDRVSHESVVSVSGIVKKREEGTERLEIPTGEIEIDVEDFTVISEANNELPFQIDDSNEPNEQIRLANRFLDLRRAKMQKNMKIRSKLLHFLRNEMHSMDFNEIHTPILTSPTPEGATDYLVPSRNHPCHHYALPQSPQQFKQLLMVGGMDRYFQIAPCFRNEDARADRAVGEFYQLDMEMSFVDQEDVITTIEKVVKKMFNCFKPENDNYDYNQEIRRISFQEAMEKYGSDRPDLRIPMENKDLTHIFKDSGFGIFKNAIKNNSIVIAILAPNTHSNSRSFFDSKIEFAKSLGGGGLAYIKFDENGVPNSPIVKLLSEEELMSIKNTCNAKNGDTVFFVCEKKHLAYKIAGETRLLLGQELGLIEKNTYKLCWIVDFPMFEIDFHTNKVYFSHNPFSKAKVKISDIVNIEDIQSNQKIDNDTLQKLESIICNQYDLVCNGYEIGGGGIRNIDTKEMQDAFSICNIDISNFNAMYKAFLNAGTPPHGGLAIGIERVLMLFCNTENIRDVITFPLNSNGIDTLMEAPKLLTDKESSKSFSNDYNKLNEQEILHYACVKNNPTIAQNAIKKGAKISYCDMYGRNPLMICIQSSSAETAKCIIEEYANEDNKKSNILAPDIFGRNILSYLNAKNDPSLKKKIIKYVEEILGKETLNSIKE